MNKEVNAVNEIMPGDLEQQNSVLFEPIPLALDYEFTLPEFMTEVFVPLGRDIRLNGLYYGRYPDAPLLIYFQGNAKNLQNFLDHHAIVLDWGYNVLVTDYRSFGKSNGTLCGQEQLYADAEKVYEFALGLGYAPHQIILYGYSMGGAMVSHLASCRKGMGLILESTFSSVNEMDFAAGRCLAYELNNAKKALDITLPTLVIHGADDQVITPGHAARISGALAAEDKKLFVLPGGHGDLKTKPGFQAMINTFINRISTQD